MNCGLSIPLSVCQDKDIFVQKCLILKYINHDLYPELNFSEIQDCIDAVIKHKDKLEILFIDLRIHDLIEDFFDYIHQDKRIKNSGLKG